MINLPTKPLPRAAASHGAAGEVNIEDNVHIYPYFDISFSFVTKRSEVFAQNSHLSLSLFSVSHSPLSDHRRFNKT
jgi:hypothetical protein